MVAEDNKTRDDITRAYTSNLIRKLESSMTETAVQTFRPLCDEKGLPRVLVRPSSASEQTEGGLFIPNQAREQPQTGEVVAVAVPMDGVQPGARVMYGKYSGTEIELNGEKLLVLRLGDVLGVLE